MQTTYLKGILRVLCEANEFEKAKQNKFEAACVRIVHDLQYICAYCNCALAVSFSLQRSQTWDRDKPRLKVTDIGNLVRNSCPMSRQMDMNL